MKIAIIENEKEDREQLQSMLSQYLSSRNIQASISHFISGDSFLEQFEPGQFQCIFLDIYMDGTDGMETARTIYKLDSSCRLIFCTSSISHAVTSYEVHAAWYLTKPLNAAQLADAMDTACTDLILNNRTLNAHSNGLELNISFRNILFMDCVNRQSKLHLNDRVVELDEHISDLIGRLDSDHRFLICNRNTIVNMDHIQRVEDQFFQLSNDERVPIRQRGRSALKKHFLDWTLRDLRKETRV